MKKNKNILITSGIILVAIIVIIIGLRNRRINQTPKTILFYGDICPHCQIVRQYINDNNIQNRLKFQELEAYHTPENTALLERYAHQCGIDTNQGIGLPFLWTGKQCLLGDQAIINFLKKR